MAKKAIEFEVALKDDYDQSQEEVFGIMYCPMCNQVMRYRTLVSSTLNKEEKKRVKVNVGYHIKRMLSTHMILVHMEDTVCPHCKSTCVTRRDLHDLDPIDDTLSANDDLVRYWLSCDNCKREGAAAENITDAIINFKYGVDVQNDCGARNIYLTVHDDAGI